MRFEFGHTHAYPGCPVRVPGAVRATDGADCLVEFSDGVVVAGRCEAGDGTIVLHVPPYRTARGTEIEAKSWQLQADADGERWRVGKRLA